MTKARTDQQTETEPPMEQIKPIDTEQERHEIDILEQLIIKGQIKLAAAIKVLQNEGEGREPCRPSTIKQGDGRP